MLFSALRASGQTDAGWPVYGGDPGGQRYSSASQITHANVASLKPAWTYHTHALDSQRPGYLSASFEATPVLFHGALYFATPFDKVIALDAQTGAERWAFDPKLADYGEGNLTTSRGVALWTSPSDEACSNRVLLGTVDARLIALDALTGKPCADFGVNGEISLGHGVEHPPGGGYEVTSAPTILGDVVVVGSSISDNYAVDVEKGTVRGFDVHTGSQLWAWEPLPWAADQAVRTGAANAWSTISADPELGLIYVPTGSPSPDYWGGMRPGDNRDADSVVALDAKTGRKVWAFQTVHHNLWDYDVAAQPLLFTWRGHTPAIVINTKMGIVFVLDRRTGVPLVPVQERAVPPSNVPGETASPMQPFSSLPAVGPTNFYEGPAGWQRDPANAAFCDQQIKPLRYQGIYTPVGLEPTLLFPGPTGGVNWGSVAIDPRTNVMYANNNRVPYLVQLLPRGQVKLPNPFFLRPWVVRFTGMTHRPKRMLGLAALLLALCWLARRSPWPSRGLGLAAILVLACFPLHAYLERRAAADRKAAQARALEASQGDDLSPMFKTPYMMHRKPIVDHDGHPCSRTPWGALTAINLDTGAKLFEVAAGTLVPGAQTGSSSLGGPVVTASGLVFTAGTREPAIRAYDAATGDELWRGELPVPAQSTPMTYEIGGRQYVVVAAGGHGLFGTPTGDSLVAFAVP